MQVEGSPNEYFCPVDNSERAREQSGDSSSFLMAAKEISLSGAEASPVEELIYPSLNSVSKSV